MSPELDVHVVSLLVVNERDVVAGMLCAVDGYALDGVAAAQAQFLAGYGSTTPGRLARARLYEALVLTKSTVRRVKLFDRNWAPRTERLIGRATLVLDRLAAGEEQTAM